ncbi:MAG: c-type cytochrome [Flavobacteriales bacterium]|nr:c-type cytochrome [Flavobacteriales bacterium]
MKLILKILAGIVILVLGFVIFVLVTYDKKFDAPYPELTASTDSSVIARGKYLAYGPAHCGTCHVPMDKIMDVENGELIPLSGGWELNIPPGSFRAPNLTPDKETGIGNYTDADIARTLRYMVNKNGGCVFPFMPFQELSDEDLTAVISYLRSQPAVEHKLERTKLSFLGKMISALGMIKPEGPKKTPAQSIKADTTAVYGEYLANYVANCVGCHTERDLKTGEFVGKPFAGGFYFEPDYFSKGYSFVSPNLTPDPGTGHIANWDRNTFIARFKAKRVYEGSPMPWGAFSRINENDVIAIYNYLQTLTPVANKIDQIVFKPGEKPKG